MDDGVELNFVLFFVPFKNFSLVTTAGEGLYINT